MFKLNDLALEKIDLFRECLPLTGKDFILYRDDFLLQHRGDICIAINDSISHSMQNREWTQLK